MIFVGVFGKVIIKLFYIFDDWFYCLISLKKLKTNFICDFVVLYYLKLKTRIDLIREINTLSCLKKYNNIKSRDFMIILKANKEFTTDRVRVFKVL